MLTTYFLLATTQLHELLVMVSSKRLKSSPTGKTKVAHLLNFSIRLLLLAFRAFP